MTSQITLNSTVSVSSEQVSSELAGEAVILDLKSGNYYGLDEVGARIWELIQKPKTVREVRDAIMAEYDVDAARCEQDLQKLLTELASQQIIEVQG